MTGSTHDGVLVVEDDTELREILVELLEDHGYRATAVSNGLEALQHLHGDGIRPCIILLDLMMPVMDGATFWTEKQRDSALASIPVVVLSAYSHSFAHVDMTGVKRFFAKPVDPRRLLDVIREEC